MRVQPGPQVTQRAPQSHPVAGVEAEEALSQHRITLSPHFSLGKKFLPLHLSRFIGELF